MGLSIIPLGGFREVGRNSVAIDIDGDIVIVDMGFHMERYIEVTQDDFPHRKHATRKLLSSGALPDLRPLRKRMRDVKAIACSHAHLDHIGAIPFLAKKFKCSVYATKFTTEVIHSLAEDKGVEIDALPQETGKIIPITDTISIEFIHVAHSVPDSSVVAIHTKYGVVLYGNDYKNDQTPPFEKPTDMNRFKELKGKVKVLMIDSLYSEEPEATESEAQARQHVLDLEPQLHGKRTIIASTFSSHIYRLRSLCDLADSLGREVMFLGRSMNRYIAAAKNAGIEDLSTRGRLLKYARQSISFLSKCTQPEKYFFIMTGHQGEPGAMLTRITKENIYPFQKKDVVIFSCSVIPAPINIANRDDLEKALSKKHVELITDVHVSGHGHAKDQEELISLLEPEYVIASHGDPDMVKALDETAKRLGYPKDKIVDVEVGRKHSF